MEKYTYDPNNNLLTKADRNGNTITYSYDNVNRMTAKQYPNSGGTVSYTYDLANRMTQVSDTTGTYGFSYDNMGRLTGTSTQYSFLPGNTYTNSYSYDAASNRTGFTAPDGSTNTYAYDSLNRLNTLTNSLTGQFGFGYDALSRRTSLTRPNGVNTSYGYDSLSHLLSILHQANGVTVDGASYTYDNAGNRLSKLNELNGVTENYTYDYIYQLTQVQQILNGSPTTTESYSYDAVGNRLSSLSVGSYSYNSSNELTSSAGGYTYTYDNNGNTLTKALSSNTTSYTWDYENRLTQVTLPGSGGTVTFKYDPLGRRIQKSSATGITNFLYDGMNSVEELDSNETPIANYTQSPGIDQPLAMQSSGSYFLEPDGLGSITSLSDASGALPASIGYAAFGNQSSLSGSVLPRFRYSGREWDSETALYQYRARYYEPLTGRFIGEDPIRFNGGQNFYVYTQNDPINEYDPTGLQTNVIVWAPVGWGESSQGHVSVEINGTSYSWGPANGGTMDIRPAADYELLNASFRTGTGYTIDLTPDQEASLGNYLAEFGTNSPHYGPLRNNCVRPVASWLRQQGYGEDFALDLTPKDLAQTLKRIPNFVVGVFGLPLAGRGDAF